MLIYMSKRSARKPSKCQSKIQQMHLRSTAALRKTQNILKKIFDGKVYVQTIKSGIYDIWLYSDSPHMHGNTCANLAPSSRFPSFPFVTLHNKIEKSYNTCVSCDTPRLKFEYHTFEGLSCAFNITIFVVNRVTAGCSNKT